MKERIRSDVMKETKNMRNYTTYFIYLLKSPLVQDQAAENTRGVGNKNWVLSDIENTLLVIPPLAEQKRIVEQINAIFNKLKDEI